MGQAWDSPTMTVKADEKKRILLPGAKPGDVFDYEEHGDGNFVLVRLNKPEPAKKMTRAEVRKAMRNCKLQPMMTWEELRSWTREP